MYASAYLHESIEKLNQEYKATSIQYTWSMFQIEVVDT